MDKKSIIIFFVVMASIVFPGAFTYADCKESMLEVVLHNERMEALKAEALQDKLTPVMNQWTEQNRFLRKNNNRIIMCAVELGREEFEKQVGEVFMAIILQSEFSEGIT